MTPEGVLKYLFIFSLSLISVLVLTPFVRKLAIHFGAIDKVAPRRLNRVPTPRGGGLAVALSFHIALAAIYLLPWREFHGSLTISWWLNFLLVSSVILILGIVDDLKGVSAINKLLFQVLSSTVLFWVGVRFENLIGIELPLYLNYLLTVFWCVGITNAFNLIDGMDGLASGLAAIGSFGIGLSLFLRGLPGDSLILFALTGATLGFLKYNFHPASIFLGDTGSLFIGFALAALSLSTESKGTTIAALGVPLLALGIPIFDTTLAIWRRSVRRVAPLATGFVNSDGKVAVGVMQVDMDHLHHRLLKRGLTQKDAAVLLYIVNFLLVMVGLASSLFHERANGIFLLAFVGGAYVVIRHIAHVELWDSGRALVQGLRRPSSRTMRTLLYPLVDFVALTFALSFTLVLSFRDFTPLQIRDLLPSLLSIWVTVPFLGLIATKTYQRVWSRARFSEFALLGVSILGGTVVAGAIDYIIERGDVSLHRTEGALYAFSSLALVGFLRAIPRFVNDVFYLNSVKMRKNEGKRVVIYGAGLRGVMFLRIFRNFYENDLILGFIDDDFNLRKRLVHGIEVLGGFEDLLSYVRYKAIDKITLACDISPESRKILERLTTNSGVEITEWLPKEEPYRRSTLNFGQKVDAALVGHG